jgi:hypothetical protein
MVLRVGLNCAIVPGKIFVTQTGRYYLTADNDGEETPRMAVRSLRLFDVPQQVSWERPASVTDMVTGLEKGLTKVSKGNIRCSLEKPVTIKEEAIGVRNATYRLISNQDLQIKDIIDGDKRVVSVFKQLGVTFADLE